MKTSDQQNEYLKSVVIPVNVLERTSSDSRRTQTFEYFIKVKDEINPNICVAKKVCKKAFLSLHNIKVSRLEHKIFKNRDQTKDMRGHNRHLTYSFEVEINIREFIENYPSRESHYSDSVKTGRKYLGSDKSMASLHRQFLDKYSTKNMTIMLVMDFFCHIFKDCNVGLNSEFFIFW
jgi:hypothetical protein